MGMFKKVKHDVEAPVVEASAPALVWGMPSRCPACSKPGYLDRVDLVDKVMYQHCPWCMTGWETTEAEILAARSVHARR